MHRHKFGDLSLPGGESPVTALTDHLSTVLSGEAASTTVAPPVQPETTTTPAPQTTPCEQRNT